MENDVQAKSVNLKCDGHNVTVCYGEKNTVTIYADNGEQKMEFQFSSIEKLVYVVNQIKSFAAECEY